MASQVLGALFRLWYRLGHRRQRYLTSPIRWEVPFPRRLLRASIVSGRSASRRFAGVSLLFTCELEEMTETRGLRSYCDENETAECSSVADRKMSFDGFPSLPFRDLKRPSSFLMYADRNLVSYSSTLPKSSSRRLQSELNDNLLSRLFNSFSFLFIF